LPYADERLLCARSGRSITAHYPNDGPLPSTDKVSAISLSVGELTPRRFNGWRASQQGAHPLFQGRGHRWIETDAADSYQFSTWRPHAPPSLVQHLKKVAYSFERLRIGLANEDYAITIALKRSRFRFTKPTREERRSNSLGTDVEPNDAAPLAIEPEPGGPEKVARCRRQPAETARGFVLQVLQIILVPAPGNTTINL
jgi:hypothetical protein